MLQIWVIDGASNTIANAIALQNRYTTVVRLKYKGGREKDKVMMNGQVDEYRSGYSYRMYWGRCCGVFIGYLLVKRQIAAIKIRHVLLRS